MSIDQRDPPSELREIHAHEAHDPHLAEIDPVAGVVPRPRVSLILVIEIIVLLLGLLWYFYTHPHGPRGVSNL